MEKRLADLERKVEGIEVAIEGAGSTWAGRYRKVDGRCDGLAG
jgi:hypothetical protein